MTLCNSKSFIWEKICPDFNCSSKRDFINDHGKVARYTNVKSKFVRSTSTTHILKSDDAKKKGPKYIVKKHYTANSDTKRPRNPKENFENELHALMLLHGHKGFPQLLYYNRADMVIFMSYCGETLTSTNVPPDWRDQLLDIYEVLKKYQIYSNDVYIGNFCVLDGNLNFIDFGFAKHHIDFCFRNLSKKDILKAKSIFEVLSSVSSNAKLFYKTLYYRY